MKHFDFGSCKSMQEISIQKAAYLKACQSQQEVIELNQAVTKAKQRILLEREIKSRQETVAKKIPITYISDLKEGKQVLHQRVFIRTERYIGVLKIEKDGSVSF